MIGFKIIENRMIILDIEDIADLSYPLVIRNRLFYKLYLSFVLDSIKNNNNHSDFFKTNEKYDKTKVRKILNLIQKYSQFPSDFKEEKNNDFENFTKKDFLILVEAIVKYWYDYPRYLIIHSDKFKRNVYMFSKDANTEDIVSLNENIRKKVLLTYRNIYFNVTKFNPSVFRQIAAGANIELYVKKNGKDVIPLPKEYKYLYPISIIATAFLRPPLILFTVANKRGGKFNKLDENPIIDPSIIEHQYFLSFPIKVGDLNILFYFHENFTSIAVGILNLFELGSSYEFRQKLDGIIIMGTKNTDLIKDEVVFYDDKKNNLMVAALELKDNKDYFGYVKKTILTVHNAIKIKNNKMPIHGAMSRITLKNGNTFNIIIVGDSGAGKSESLEAFRILSKNYLKGMDIIFDDMGSIYLHNGQVYAQGTEIGAFVRLDDLDPGFAFGRMEKSIFMNPHILNARVVVPVSPYKEVISHHKVDMFLYANNYEVVDEEKPELEIFDNIYEAFTTFRNGARLSKGTTDEVGLVTSYFANPFGAPSYKKDHDKLAMSLFKVMYDNNIFVGQLRTQLGITKYANEGPKQAAKALFKYLMENY